MASPILSPRDTVFRIVATSNAVNAITGAWESEPLTGRADGTLHIATTRDGAALGSTSTALTEATEGGVYFCTISGTILASALGASPAGATVYAVPLFGSTRVESIAYTWQPLL